MRAARPLSPAWAATAWAMGGTADVVAPLLATGLFAALGWAVCLKLHLILPDAMQFPLVGALCGSGGAQEMGIRMGVGMALMCPPPVPPRTLATRAGLGLAVLWVLALAAAALGAQVAGGLAVDHAWLPRALGLALLLASCGPVAALSRSPARATCRSGALLGFGCLRRCVGVMGVMLVAGLMSAPWMLGCAVLMRLDTLRPDLALGPRAGLVAATLLALGLT